MSDSKLNFPVDCLRVLAGSGSIHSKMADVLPILRGSTGASRAYIFRNENDPVLGLCMTHIHESCAQGVSPQIDLPDLKRLPYSENGSILLPCLQAHRPYAGLTSEMTGRDRELMSRQGILSVLIVPIFSDDMLWGFIGFDDTENQRSWQPEETEILRGIADALGMEISRDNRNSLLRESKENFRRFFDSMDDIAVVATVEGAILYSNRAAREQLGYSSAELEGMSIPDLHQETRRGEARAVLISIPKGQRTKVPSPFRRRMAASLPWKRRSGPGNGAERTACSEYPETAPRRGRRLISSRGSSGTIPLPWRCLHSRTGSFRMLTSLSWK